MTPTLSLLSSSIGGINPMDCYDRTKQHMKYWLPPSIDTPTQGPTWRNLGFPAIALGGLWYLGWKWSKTSDNQLDWNNFKLHASQQARQSLGMEDHIHTVGADTDAKSYGNLSTNKIITPVVPGQKPPKVVNQAPSYQPSSTNPERFRD